MTPSKESLQQQAHLGKNLTKVFQGIGPNGQKPPVQPSIPTQNSQSKQK